jgi:glucosamine-6-phosphate deaminase
MEIRIVADEEQRGEVVADLVEQMLREAGTAPVTLGLATGSSPLPAYTELIRRHRENGLSFAPVNAVLLDEYVGLPAEHEQSYHRFIRDSFTAHIDIDDRAVHSPNGCAEDPDAEALAYDRRIREGGGVDLQILGIGSNGHIAFNEPGSSLASRTRVVSLTRSTISDNARFFDSTQSVPLRAISQGLGTIGEARRIVLTASGESKAEAVAQMAEGPVSARWPATTLQFHPDVTVVIDEAAASRLELEDYSRLYREPGTAGAGADHTAR